MSTFASNYFYYWKSKNSYCVKSTLKWLRQEIKTCNKTQNTCWLARKDSTGELGTLKERPSGRSKPEMGCTFCRQKCFHAIVEDHPNSFWHCYWTGYLMLSGIVASMDSLLLPWCSYCSITYSASTQMLFIMLADLDIPPSRREQPLFFFFNPLFYNLILAHCK